MEFQDEQCGRIVDELRVKWVEFLSNISFKTLRVCNGF